MEDSDFDLDLLLIAVPHFFGNFVVEKKIGTLIKVYLAIKAPVKSLKQSGFTERIIAKNNRHVLFRIKGKINLSFSTELTEVFHLKCFN